MTSLKHRLLLLVTTLWTGLCLALPAPHDIEQAVAQGHLTQAEQMLREVIAEKPRSAKAHYELAQVLAREGQHAEALQAIRTAREIDPSLQFAQSSDKFNAVAHSIEQQAAPKPAAHTPALTPPASVQAAPQPAAQPAWLWPALLTGAFALLALWLWRRVQSQPALQPGLQPQAAGMGGYAPEAPRGFGAQYDPSGAPRGPAAGYGSAYPAPAAGSGVAGAVVGGLAGVAAGYALSKALENHDHPANTGSAATPSRPADPMEDIGRVRMDDPDPSNDLGSFDAGAGDSWDDAGGDSDNW